MTPFTDASFRPPKAAFALADILIAAAQRTLALNARLLDDVVEVGLRDAPPSPTPDGPRGWLRPPTPEPLMRWAAGLMAIGQHTSVSIVTLASAQARGAHGEVAALSRAAHDEAGEAAAGVARAVGGAMSQGVATLGRLGAGPWGVAAIGRIGDLVADAATGPIAAMVDARANEADVATRTLDVAAQVVDAAAAPAGRTRTAVRATRVAAGGTPGSTGSRARAPGRGTVRDTGATRRRGAGAQGATARPAATNSGRRRGAARGTR